MSASGPARCPGLNPAACVIGLLTGGGGFRANADIPPPAPKGMACEAEIKFEQQLLRLQVEQRRLKLLNENLRNEIFFRDSAPVRAASRAHEIFEHIPTVQKQLYEDDDSVKGRNSRLSPGAENIESEIDLLSNKSGINRRDSMTGRLYTSMRGTFNGVVLKGSALALTRPAQAVIYFVALSFVIFVLLASAFHLGAHEVHHACGSASGASGGSHTSGAGSHASCADLGSHASGASHASVYGHSAVSSASSLASHSATSAASGLTASAASAEASAEASAAESHASALASTQAGVESSADAAAAHGEEDDFGDQDPNADAHGAHHRRLGGGVSPVMRNIGFTMTAAGLSTMAVNFANMPLILGYLIAGIMVGPVCLGLVESHLEIAELSSLGLVFLLFMIGLELDMRALFKMGKVSIVTGVVQYPICAAIMTALFVAMTAIGAEFGSSGMNSAIYCGMAAGLSSDLIIVKLLGQKGETDTIAGRTTMGVLICQDIWAIVLLALQVNLSDFNFVGVVKTLGMLTVLITLTLGYAKFVMPAVLHHASKSVELMLVLSLAWCFFVCTASILPFVGLPMELAALIAGTALGTFPYSTDFNEKVKYIRDFFVCLFFAGMGMMLPVPRAVDVFLGIFLALVAVLVRAAGVFLPIWLMSKNARVAALASVNLGQIGEFGLVLCTLGVSHGHIDESTLETILIAFLCTTILSPILIRNSVTIFVKVRNWYDRTRGNAAQEADAIEDDGEERDIVLLGFHKIAFMLMAEIQARTPELLSTMHVIDFNGRTLSKLEAMGIKCSCGDISSRDVLAKAQSKPPRIVISTIPDALLQGTCNKKLIRVVHDVWPTAKVIVTADNPHTAQELYDAGADYVLRISKLSAERLEELLSEHCNDSTHSSLTDLFTQYKDRDNTIRGEWLSKAQKW
mmetsp:Transcript_99602/g.319642  ORF Transcript_99602/g.319642 Transcript_99602/m.319642 type:complete len:916 (+) Transcript_99602:84-2831(+)